jgi:hypothetical protein
MKSVYTQIATFRSDRIDELIALAREWDALQASQEPMGYMETSVLADRHEPGRYAVIIDFGVVDPDVSAAHEAFLNNERDQTRDFANRIAALVNGEPEWHYFDELYRTTFGQEEISDPDR